MRINKTLCIFMWAVLIIPVCAHADIYKCISDDGVVKYSDAPCGKRQETVVKSPSPDHLITLARPYKQPIVDPDRITGDLIAYSKEIGASILPNARFDHSYKYVNDKRTSFLIVLYYAPEEGYVRYQPTRYPMWDIRIKYHKRRNRTGYTLWLTYISIKLDRTPFSPQTMEHVKTLKKTRPGKWVAQ